jgi:hypothetical protein
MIRSREARPLPNLNSPETIHVPAPEVGRRSWRAFAWFG